MISGFHIAVVLYLLCNAIQAAYHAGKGEWEVTFKKNELIMGAVAYAGIAAIIVVFQ